MKPNLHINEKKLCAVFFAVYAIITFIGACQHECWYDEAQAWCIARDNDIPGLIQALRFEGHPPLWYLILFPFVKLGCPVGILPFISWGICTVTAWLITYRSPFHISVRFFVLYSAGFLYYNSIVSRTYCIIILLLCLLAMIYPKRNDHPLLYGLMVGLLAMTHVIMSGLVGILGIYMLIDFCKNFKKNTAKKKLMDMAGMVIALSGVILLVLPLLFSVQSNDIVVSNQISADVLFKRLSNVFVCIGSYLCKFSSNSYVGALIGALVTALLIIALILLRRYPRAVAAFVVFSVFFFLATQIIYRVMLAARAAVYLYTFLFILWAAKNTDQPKFCDITLDSSKFSSSILQKWAQKLIRIDTNFFRSISVIVCVICAVSFPRGIFMLVSDYCSDYDYTGAKDVTDYIINQEISLKDSVFILDGEPSCSTYCAMLPGMKVYSTQYQRILTYNPNSIEPDPIKGKDEAFLKKFNNIYSISFIKYKNGEQTFGDDKNVLLQTTLPSEYDFNSYYQVELRKLSEEDLKKI